MSRDVVWRLRIERDPRLREELQGFAAEAARAEQEARRTASGTAPGSSPSFRQEARAQRIKDEKETLGQIQDERDSVRELEERVAADHQANQLKRLEKFAQERAKVERDLAEELASIREATNTDNEASVRRSQRKIRDAQAKAAERLDDIHAKLEAEKLKQSQAATKARLALLKQEERAAESQQAQLQSLQGQVKAGNRESLAMFAELTSSTMQFARGLTSLGLAGEEDMEKIVQGLLRVQGAFDVVSGGIQTFVKFQQILETTRRTLLATAAAEELLAASSLKRGAAQASSGAIGGVGGGFMGGVMGAGGALASRLGLAGVGGTSTMLLGAGGLALGGAAFGGSQIAEFAGAASRNGLGGGASPGGFMDAIAQQEINAAILLNRTFGLSGMGRYGTPILGQFNSYVDTEGVARSSDALERQQGRTSRMEELIANRRNRVNAALPELQRRFAQRASTRARNLSLDLEGMTGSDEQSARVAKEILEIEKEIASVKDAASQTQGAFMEAQKTLLQEQAALEERKRDLAEQRAQIEYNASQQTFEASRRALAVMDQRLDAQQSRLLQMQAGLRGSREAFGLRDEASQRQLLDIFKRGQSGEALNVEELRLLRGVQSQEAQDIVSKQARARASAAGADVLFGRERAAIAGLEGDIARNVEVRADLAWDVRFDKEAMEEQKRALVKVIRDNMAELNEGMQEEVMNAMRGEIGGLDTRVGVLEGALQNGGGGRN